MGLWTSLHAVTFLPSLAVMIAAALILRKLFIDKSFEKRMLPIKIIAVMLVVLEIIKQITSLRAGYDLYHLPFHFCSIFIYALPFFAFYRGKYAQSVRSVACATMTGLFLGMLVMPAIIYSDVAISEFFVTYISFHRVFFHNLVVFATLIIFFLDLHKPSGKGGEAVFVTLFAVIFVIIAASASHLLDTNYSNFLSSTVDFVDALAENLALKVGEGAFTAIYTACAAVLHIGFILGMNYLYLALCLLKERLSKKRI